MENVGGRPQKLLAYFKGRSYGNVADLLTHASQISQAIRVHQRKKTEWKPPGKLNDFHKLVLKIASSATGGVSPAFVAREIIRHRTAVPVKRPDRTTYQYVVNALRVLKYRGLLPNINAPRAVSQRGLSEFSHLIIRIAPHFKTVKQIMYDHKAITREVARAEGKNPDEMNEKDFAKLRVRVSFRISTLQNLGYLPRSSLPSKYPRLRKATGEDVEKHRHLIQKVLRSGHSWVFDWRKHLDESEAVSCGERGLVTAIEKFNPSKGIPFEAFAKLCIRGYISSRLKGLRRRKMFSLDDAGGILHLPWRGELARPAFDPEIFQTKLDSLLAKHREGAVKPHQLMLYVLHGFGHSFGELGSFFGTSKQAVHHNIINAKKALEKTEK